RWITLRRICRYRVPKTGKPTGNAWKRCKCAIFLRNTLSQRIKYNEDAAVQPVPSRADVKREVVTMPCAPVKPAKMAEPQVEPFAFAPDPQNLAALWSMPFRAMMVVMTEAMRPYR
ncbi:MAG: hypothetical protein AAFP67_11215, partial [Pseudomonadota bacterium]